MKLLAYTALIATASAAVATCETLKCDTDAATKDTKAFCGAYVWSGAVHATSDTLNAPKAATCLASEAECKTTAEAGEVERLKSVTAGEIALKGTYTCNGKDVVPTPDDAAAKTAMDAGKTLNTSLGETRAKEIAAAVGKNCKDSACASPLICRRATGAGATGYKAGMLNIV